MFWSAPFRDDSGWTGVPVPSAPPRRDEAAQLDASASGGIGSDHSVPEASASTRSPLEQVTESKRWGARVARLKAWDRDVRLGAGMVAAFCAVVVTTAPALDLRPGTRGAVFVVCAALGSADLVLLLFGWDRYGRQRLLVFPALLLIGEVALALCTKGVSPEYTGFFTLGFVFIGLTQPRGTGVAFALPAAVCWIVSQQQWAPGLAIRLGLSVVVWLLISGTLSVRTSRDQNSSRRLVTHAYTDVLTGLGNRRAISDRVEQLTSKPVASESAVLLIDLDGFKKVNDTFGHAAGDELLVVAAKRIQANLREGDLAGRLGGDEFAIVLNDGGLDQAREVAARMIDSLAAPIVLSRMRLSVTASIGIVKIVPPATVEEVLNHADLAMYQAKAAGRNQVTVYENTLHVQMVRRLEVETELRDAVDRDEFEAHYQPIVHMGTGAVIGVEALARWRHPRRGLLAPADFLVACQELGLIQTLGERLLRIACCQATYWQPIDPARAISLAFNLSAEEVFAPGLVGRIERTLELTELPANLLILEVTEQVAMVDKMRARQAMKDLQSLGVRIAIDDFGAGYSSLTYLREFPVNILKIDRSFVASLGLDDRALALFRSILAIAEALSLDVVVEGVETREQAQILVELGCLVAQGFYFARPRPAEELARSADLWPRSLQG
ncbi:MAG: bifunctional diguanylate cyclase/phosphodiesterase [Acidimicrobiales bacterium]